MSKNLQMDMDELVSNLGIPISNTNQIYIICRNYFPDIPSITIHAQTNAEAQRKLPTPLALQRHVLAESSLGTQKNGHKCWVYSEKVMQQSHGMDFHTLNALNPKRGTSTSICMFRRRI